MSSLPDSLLSAVYSLLVMKSKFSEVRSELKANVLEVFRSIQGEGKYAGQEQVFVRFFECNMHCVWCDTPHSIGDGRRQYDEYSLPSLVETIRGIRGNCRAVTLTGGEPLLQADCIRELASVLRREEMRIHLETNGILPDELKKVIDAIDVIAMDIKMPSSTRCRSYWEEHEEFLRTAVKKEVFIKTVVSGETAFADLERAVELVEGIDPDILFILQPNYFEMREGVVRKCEEWQEYCSSRLNNVRILPQIHKFMKLR